jgi:hypothetical protein
MDQLILKELVNIRNYTRATALFALAAASRIAGDMESAEKFDAEGRSLL